MPIMQMLLNLSLSQRTITLEANGPVHYLVLVTTDAVILDRQIKRFSFKELDQAKSCFQKHVTESVDQGYVAL